MASKLDEGATRFRSLSKQDAIARLKTASDKMFDIFDALDEKSWSGEIVPHTFMGPLPAYFFAAFQLLDYSIHSWDAKAGLGRDEPLSDAAAVTLIPFMMIVLQYTVDAQRRGPEGKVRHRDHRAPVADPGVSTSRARR